MNIDYGHYARLGCWASGEAICLLIGINPADYANLLEAQLTSRDPDDIDFLCSYSRGHTEQLQQDKALSLMRKNKIAEIQAFMRPIEQAMERDLLTGIIKQLVTKDGTTYFAPVAFVTWAASKGFEIPLELSKLKQDKAATVETVNWNDDPDSTKLEKQHQAILEVIRLKQFDPMKIPDGEKGTIRSICEADYPSLFDGTTSFDNAWKEGRKLFKMENHASYARRGGN